MQSESELLRQIEALRQELHRRMGGRYTPSQTADLERISRELDRLVVEYTRIQWQARSRENGTR